MSACGFNRPHSKHQSLRCDLLITIGLLYAALDLKAADRIYVRDSYFYLENNPQHILMLPTLEIGLSCRSPLAAVQFVIEPLAPGIQSLPVFNSGENYCQGKYWLIEGQVKPDGSIKIIALDTLLQGKPLNPNEEFYSFGTVEYQVDSLVPSGIYPVNISNVQACDTAGNLIPLGVSGGKVSISRREALFYAPPDTISNQIGQYTWRLYESNIHPIGWINFDLRVPLPGFQLEKIVTGLFTPEWEINYQQDSVGVIKFRAWQTSPLITRPCWRSTDILPISMTFTVDSSLNPGVYQFELIHKYVEDCTGNFALTTEAVLSPLVVTTQSITVENSSTIPESWSLGPNYPNPFNAETCIQFAIPKASLVKLEIFNLKGEQVAKLMDATVDAGHYQVLWRAAHLPTGIYLISLRAGDLKAVQKLTLLK